MVEEMTDDAKAKFPVNLDDIEVLAYQRMVDLGHADRADGWTHRKGGVETGSTWRRSKDIYGSLGLRSRMINDLAYDDLDLSAAFAGQKIRVPISVAPMVSGILFVCDKPFDKIARTAAGLQVAAGIGYPSAAQVYRGMVQAGAKTFRIIKPAPDRSRLVQELQDSYAAGCIAAGVDIDSIGGMKPVGDEVRFAVLARPYGKDELKRVRDAVPGPFIIKGVMSVEDALDAREIGADIIVVSTHVGYSLDYSPAPLEVIGEIRAALGNSMEIVLDSGITRGTDIIKAIALGADSVLIGRLALWGLLLGGGEGLRSIFERLEGELRRTMILMGVPSLSALSPKNLRALDERGERILKNL